MALYSWGSNKAKQLPNHLDLHCYLPKYFPANLNSTPTQVAAGEGHTLILCESGELFSVGSGRDGQLGQGGGVKVSLDCGKVKGLENETVVSLGAGPVTSYAITASGDLYQWGLIHCHSRSHAFQSQELVGLAQDQETLIVADADARAAHASHSQLEDTTATTWLDDGEAGDDDPDFNPRFINPDTARRLRDIVKDSTTRWQLPTIENDREYENELIKMGHSEEERKEKLSHRKKEYVAMLRLGCSRRPQPIPVRVTGMDHVRVSSVSAGYAHTIVLSEDGRLFGSGYNDRGQLGLGHRINTSTFKPLDFLHSRFVVQVSCGQQHTICRAIPRISGTKKSSEMESSFEPEVGSDCGANVYVWGNGILGQLGLGLLGTTKGRLFPTLNDALYDAYPEGIVSVSAGANFSVVVAVDGSVFSFGHAEYNQHGDNSYSNSDYVHSQYYFVPRRVPIEKAHTLNQSNAKDRNMLVAPIPITSVCCGANYTVAVDAQGDCFSWGWNESGVLGHGMRHFSSSPQRVDNIGVSYDRCKVLTVACGSKHVVVLTEPQGHAWASCYHSILYSSKHYDCVIHDESASTSILRGAIAASTEFPCHRAVLAARSPYLHGLLMAVSHNKGYADKTVVHFALPTVHANAVTIRSLLEYLYLDRVSVPFHKKEELLRLATDLQLSRLVDLLSAATDATRLVLSQDSQFSRQIGMTMLGNATHADLLLVVPPPGKKNSTSDDERSNYFDPTLYDHVLFAHRGIISQRLPYFQALLESGFADSGKKVIVRTDALGKVVSHRCSSTVFTHNALLVDISGLLQLEGVNMEVFQRVIMFAYIGQFEVEQGNPANQDLDIIMRVLICANAVGFMALVQFCERRLCTQLLNFGPDELQTCYEFAQALTLPRLERQSILTLRKLSNSNPNAV